MSSQQSALVHDPAKSHPAFEGMTFYQQRRVHVNSAHPFPLSTPPPPPPASAHPPDSTPSTIPALLDPARTSPIFYGYIPKTEKPKM
ncbi:hypothetical protein BGW42_000506 [Actinomortierella wolfii]|nr:hypothetical protein BGW42_000506 [Actinomortierella wolfii]